MPRVVFTSHLKRHVPCPEAHVQAATVSEALRELEPALLWERFSELTRIARPSKEEGTTRAAVYRYSGRRWVPVDGPSVAGSDTLTAVDALPDGTLLAVGWKDVDVERETLAIRGASCPAAD